MIFVRSDSGLLIIPLPCRFAALTGWRLFAQRTNPTGMVRWAGGRAAARQPLDVSFGGEGGVGGSPAFFLNKKITTIPYCFIVIKRIYFSRKWQRC